MHAAGEKAAEVKDKVVDAAKDAKDAAAEKMNSIGEKAVEMKDSAVEKAAEIKDAATK